jgi:hypothetical protein
MRLVGRPRHGGQLIRRVPPEFARRKAPPDVHLDLSCGPKCLGDEWQCLNREQCVDTWQAAQSCMMR